MKVNAPCKECKERHHKCHSTCEMYIEWTEKRKEKPKGEMAEIILNDYEIHRSKKLKDWRERVK